MQQLYFLKKEKLEWREVKDPIIENGLEALVRPFAVSKCDLDDIYLFSNMSFKLEIGNRLGLIDKDFFKLFGKNFFKGPFPFGHECVAEVIEVGNKVKIIKPGDVVSVPFQISCGSCAHCNLGITSSCQSTEPISTYGFGKHLQFGGAMADKLKVPFADAMLLKIHESINPLHLASLGDNIADAYRNVGPVLETNPNTNILVIGGKAKSVGLYTVLIAKAMGAMRVDYVDNDKERLSIAGKAGAENVFESFSEILDKYDLVVEASSGQSGLAAAVRYVKPYGHISSSGIYIKKTSVPLIEMYYKGVTFKTGLTNARPEAEKVLNLIVNQKLNPETITSMVYGWEDAIDGFLSKTSKVIVTRERLFTQTVESQ